MLSYNELKPGTLFVKDGEPYRVLDYSFVRKQQRKPVVQLKIRNLASGKVQEFTVHQSESFEEAEIETTPVVFIYKRKGEYWFHETENPGKRFFLGGETIGDAGRFLRQDAEVKILRFRDPSNQLGAGKIVGVELLVKMDFRVIEAPPRVLGATAQGGTKTVTIETGAKINAPLFINKGDIIRVNTQTGEYAERVEKV